MWMHSLKILEEMWGFPDTGNDRYETADFHPTAWLVVGNPPKLTEPFTIENLINY